MSNSRLSSNVEQMMHVMDLKKNLLFAFRNERHNHPNVRHVISECPNGQ